MQPTSVQPLLVRAIASPVIWELLPLNGESFPAADAATAQGIALQLHEDDAHRVRKYLQRHSAQSLRRSDNRAFSLKDNRLVECRTHHARPINSAIS